MKILFFCRTGCNYSSIALSYIQKYFDDVTVVETGKRDSEISNDIRTWQGDVILSFRNLFIIDDDILKRATKYSINFHSGPPKYPGSGCTNFALLDNSKEYGVTAHLMNNRVDTGAIYKVNNFEILPDDNIDRLTVKTHEELIILFKDVVDDMANGLDIAKLSENSGIKWSGVKRRISAVDKLQRMELDINTEEIEKRVRALHTKDFPIELKIGKFLFTLNS